MSDYTKWQVVKDRHDHWGKVEVLGPRLTVVGFTVATDATADTAREVIEQAHIIAAAPDLYAALEGLLKESQWFTKERQGHYGESYRPTDGEAEAQAAILKAEGGAT